MALIRGLNDFLPAFPDDIFAFENMEETAGYISGDSDTTPVFLFQFVFEPAVFIYVYVKVWKNTDKSEILEKWQGFLRKSFTILKKHAHDLSGCFTDSL